MLKSKFYEQNQKRALQIIEELPENVRAKFLNAKASNLGKNVLPSANFLAIKGKIEKLVQSEKVVGIKKTNITPQAILIKNEKVQFKEDKTKKLEEIMKENYNSDVSSSSLLNVSTDNLSARVDKKTNSFTF